jgi:hypothetical protein
VTDRRARGFGGELQSSHPHAPFLATRLVTRDDDHSAAELFESRVSSGEVVAARDSSGQAVADFTITIDRIWDELLAARANGELNSARFDFRVVPNETDMGEWPVDGGRHYSVRNFAVNR